MDPTQMPLGDGMAGQASQQLQMRQKMIALQEAAANGDPQAQQILQQMQGGGQPQGAPPGMSQSQFGNGGQPAPPDVQAQRAKQLIQLLRQRGG